MAEMVKVRALKVHGNEFGEAYSKNEGDTYACPRGHAELLSRQGTVEIVAAEAAPTAAPATPAAPGTPAVAADEKGKKGSE